MLNFGFTKVNVNFVGAQVGVEDGVDSRNIVLSHFSEPR